MRVLFILFLFFTSLMASDQSANSDVNIEDVHELTTKKYVQKWLDGKIGLEPHKPNYILPYGVSDRVYESYVPSDQYKNIEAELQVSLKLKIAKNFFGLGEMYYMSYTHTAFWQVYTKSSPFRETNYNPEMFVVFPIEDSSFLGLRSIDLHFEHLSNGQGNIDDVDNNNTCGLKNRSRSINYFSSTIRFQHESLITDFKFWIPNSYNGDLSDNPDIMKYIGYTSLDFKYFYNKSLFDVMTRLNLATGYGAIRVAYSYPILDDAYFYAKFFNGYGESLIDYDNNINKISFGFSFSR